jgi:hypothetical protein
MTLFTFATLEAASDAKSALRVFGVAVSWADEDCLVIRVGDAREAKRLFALYNIHPL